MLFTSTGRYHPARTICASPNASLESVLLICIDSAAFACRAWMHTIGTPAAFSACQCQTASGPVSIATFTARSAFVRTASAIASGVERHVPCHTRAFGIDYTDRCFLLGDVQAHILFHRKSSWR